MAQTKSKMVEEQCVDCDGEGQICHTCHEPEPSCECDEDDKDPEDCGECDGRGTVEVERCTVCGEIVDNCNGHEDAERAAEEAADRIGATYFDDGGGE